MDASALTPTSRQSPTPYKHARKRGLGDETGRQCTLEPMSNRANGRHDIQEHKDTDGRKLTRVSVTTSSRKTGRDLVIISTCQGGFPSMSWEATTQILRVSENLGAILKTPKVIMRLLRIPLHRSNPEFRRGKDRPRREKTTMPIIDCLRTVTKR